MWNSKTIPRAGPSPRFVTLQTVSPLYWGSNGVEFETNWAVTSVGCAFGSSLSTQWLSVSANTLPSPARTVPSAIPFPRSAVVLTSNCAVAEAPDAIDPIGKIAAPPVNPAQPEAGDVSHHCSFPPPASSTLTVPVADVPGLVTVTVSLKVPPASTVCGRDTDIVSPSDCARTTDADGSATATTAAHAKANPRMSAFYARAMPTVN